MALTHISNTMLSGSRCCVFGCKKVPDGTHARHFFSVRTEWIKVIRIDRRDQHWNPSKYSRLCNLHFEPQDIRSLQQSARVKDGKLPTKYLRAPVTTPLISPTSQVAQPQISSLDIENGPVSTRRRQPLVFQPYSTRVNKTLSQCQNKLKLRTDTVRRLKNTLNKKSQEMKALKSRIDELESTASASEKRSFLLQTILDNEDQRLTRKSSSGMRYSEDMKKLSYIIHSISAQCYRFLRLSLTLPDERSLFDWTSSIDCNPGIQLEHLSNLKQHLDEQGHQHSHVHVITDDIFLKKSPDFNKHEGKYMGHVNYGPNVSAPENPPLASSSSLFLLSGLTGWKKSIGYVFSASSSGRKSFEYHADLLRTLKAFNFHVTSLGTDSHRSNVSVMEQMGVPQKDLGSKFKFTTEDFEGIRAVYCIMHLVKNWRGAFFELEQFFLDDTVIDIIYIYRLHNIQTNLEHIRAGNLITDQVINYKDNIMKTKLAMKIFSNSSAAALTLASCDPKYRDQFQNYEPTKKFILDMNKAIDILNSKNSNQKGDSEPLTPENLAVKEDFLKSFCQMILKLKIKKTIKKKVGPKKYENVKTDEKIFLHESTRKGIVINMITTINSILDIAHSYFDVPQNERLFTEIPTYIFSGDRIEKVFSGIRGSLGYNDNPTPSQQRRNMKRLYYNVVPGPSKNGNCAVDTADDRLGATLLPFKRTRYDRTPKNIIIGAEEFLNYDVMDEIKKNDGVFFSSTVAYIAGACVNQLLKDQKLCKLCGSALLSSDIDPLPTEASVLIRTKHELKFGSSPTNEEEDESTENCRLKMPSGSVVKICKIADHLFRSEMKNSPSSAPATPITSKVIQSVVAGCRTEKESIFPTLANHDNDHYLQLIASVARQYVVTHCYDYTVQYQRKVNSTRRKTKKLVQFRESAGMSASKGETVQVQEESNGVAVDDQPGPSEMPVTTTKTKTKIISKQKSKLWCSCKKPHNNRFMILCDGCNIWFHGSCVGLQESAADKLIGRKWFCPKCRTNQKE